MYIIDDRGRQMMVRVWNMCLPLLVWPENLFLTLRSRTAYGMKKLDVRMPKVKYPGRFDSFHVLQFVMHLVSLCAIAMYRLWF